LNTLPLFVCETAELGRSVAAFRLPDPDKSRLRLDTRLGDGSYLRLPIFTHIRPTIATRSRVINAYKKLTRSEFTPNVTSLYFATLLAFNAPDGGVPLGRSP